MKTVKTISIVVLSLITFACGSSTEQETTVEIQQKSPTEVKAMLADDNVMMIDVRTPEELKTKAYDVDNIVNIPLDEFDQHLKEIPKNKTIIVACRSGKRSSKAANILLENGYKNIVNLNGGILKWEKEGLGVTAQKSCCSDPTSSNCNPDGTCKTTDTTQTKSACCSDPNSPNCNPDGTCKTDNDK